MEKHKQDLGMEGRVIVKWIFKRQDGLDSSGLSYGRVASSLKHGNESSEFRKMRKLSSLAQEPAASQEDLSSM
jgi:hypothetical protein